MRILLCYINHKAGAHRWYQQIAASAPSGHHIDTFCISLPGINGRISWTELDLRVRLGCPALTRLYKNLLKLVENYDIIWNYNGSMLHPTVLKSINAIRVLSCFDDPEDFYDLVSPVHSSYDLVLYGNYASKFLFNSLPVPSYWLPIFTQPDIQNSCLLNLKPPIDRDIDIIFIGGISGFSSYRKQRLLKLKCAFPNALCIGRGWESGFVDNIDIPSLYRRAKIGWNVHRSVGPVNERTFDLAAYGVAQVCDNHFFLKDIFSPSEALGFSDIDEAINHTNRLLVDDKLRSTLSTNSQLRYFREYSPIEIWKVALNYFACFKKPERKILKHSTAMPSKVHAYPALPFSVSSKLWRVFSSAKCALNTFISSIHKSQSYTYQTLKMSDQVYCRSLSVAKSASSHAISSYSFDIPEYVISGCINLLPSASHVHVIKAAENEIVLANAHNYLLISYALIKNMHVFPKTWMSVCLEGVLIVGRISDCCFQMPCKVAEFLASSGLKFVGSYRFPFVDIPWVHRDDEDDPSAYFSVLRYEVCRN